MKLVTVAEMRIIESTSNELGLSYTQMMENAGSRLAEIIENRYGPTGDGTILGLVGSGNNGGDTLIALEKLAGCGWNTVAYLTRLRPNDPLIDRLINSGGQVITQEDDNNFAKLGEQIDLADIVLDGVLGTGFELPLKTEVSSVLSFVNARLHQDVTVVAVDCPSGVNCDTGEVDAACIAAELTVCMAAVKIGLMKMPAFKYIGDLEVADIGIPGGVKAWDEVKSIVVSQEDVYRVLPDRPLDAHKGTFGSATIVAGSINYTGAASFAGRAAYRVGTGLVCLAIPSVLHTALAANFPEAIWLLLPHEMGVISNAAAEVLLKNIGRSNAILIGPGLGTESTTAEFLIRILSGKMARGSKAGIGFVTNRPIEIPENCERLPALILDADGLILQAEYEDWWENLPSETILTPHPGEMAKLTGLTVDEIQKDRIDAAVRFAEKWKAIVVLKGAVTVVAHPDGRYAIIPVATAALAKAGTGDVLSGVITGLRAQGINAFEAAWAGAWLHGKAGQVAGWQIGSTAAVLASDVLDSLAVALPPD